MKTSKLFMASLIATTLFTACSSYEDYSSYDYKKSAKWLNATNMEAKDIPQLFGTNGIEYDYIMCVNWEKYQYKPNTVYAIAYTDSAILLHFVAKEKALRAFCNKDKDSVWTDACVSFFFEPNKDGNYYAIFSNCTGHMYMDFGHEKANRDTSTIENLLYIQRWTSMGTQALPVEIQEETEWELAMIIPFKAFWRHDIPGIAGLKANVNFYKCGGSGEYEHYMSWRPITTPEPDFYQPAYFKEITFLEHK